MAAPEAIPALRASWLGLWLVRHVGIPCVPDVMHTHATTNLVRVCVPPFFPEAKLSKQRFQPAHPQQCAQHQLLLFDAITEQNQ